jgi:hypothetical protein
MNDWPYGLAAAVGGAGALIDRRLLRWPLLGGLFVVVALGGLLTMQASPFTFGGGRSYYMEGVIASAAGAIAFAVYLVIRVAAFAYTRLSGGKTS